MAENIIKDFVKKQTTPLNIGVPKQRPQGAAEVRFEEPAVETAAPAPAPVPAPAPAAVQAVEPEAVKGHVGRPKSDVEKVKLSVYVPAEAKAKLVKIQHHNYKQSLNDVLLEAISDVIKKYGE